MNELWEGHNNIVIHYTIKMPHDSPTGVETSVRTDKIHGGKENHYSKRCRSGFDESILLSLDDVFWQVHRIQLGDCGA